MKPTFYGGIVFFFLSYLQLVIPDTYVTGRTLVVCWFFFMTGIVLMCDGVTQRLNGKSLLRQIIKRKDEAMRFFVISVAGGIMFEGVAQWLGKLWVYPYFSIYTYALVFALGFSLYWLMIVESYLATKTVIDYVRRGKRIIRNHWRLEPGLYRALGLLGFILTPLSVILILKDYSARGGYIFSISRPVDYKVNFIYVITLFLGTWFLLEYIEYARKKTSLLKDIVHEYFAPLAAILIASTVLAVVMETENGSHAFWVYTNWPLERIKVLGLPVMVFVAWPLHYVTFLSLFRAFAVRELGAIWSGDLIK